MDRKSQKIILAVLLIVVGGWFLFFNNNGNNNVVNEVKELQKADEEVNEDNMKLTSTAFKDNEIIPSKYTCDGEDINPSLTISDVPEAAKSMALIVDDPDAPSGDWVHWLVWNIDPSISEINEGEIPSEAVQGKTDFGKNEYGGPCPPSGSHRYQFKLYALDTKLDIDKSAKKKDLVDAMEGHILQETMLTGLYERE